MKHLKAVEIPAKIENRVDKITCDFCESIIKKENYKINEVTLEYKEGVSYPDFHSSTTTIFDCCYACWEEKVVPVLQRLGAKPRIEESCY